MLLSLHILLDTLAPAEDAPTVRTLLGAITGEPLLCLLVAAALTWAAHSSVTVVLLVMSLAYSHFITPVAALALVLGANLGSAINPLIEGSHGGIPPAAACRSAIFSTAWSAAASCFRFCNRSARNSPGIEPNPVAHGRRFPHGLQRSDGARFHPAAGRRGIVAEALVAGPAYNPAICQRRSIWTKPP